MCIDMCVCKFVDAFAQKALKQMDKDGDNMVDIKVHVCRYR